MAEEQKTHMQRYTDSLVIEYPDIIKFVNEQLKVFWLPDEPRVEKDIHDILTNFDEDETHGTITTLKLFSAYELKAGAEYWGDRFVKIFNRHEFQRAGHTFAMVELAIHKPFYKRINELLHLESDEFYTSYIKDPVLNNRIKFIDQIVNHENDLYSLAVFSMVEGVILYSSFAFLKHFQSKGKNKLLNIVRGINFSVRDENLHSMAGAYCFKTLKEQMKLSEGDEEKLKEIIYDAARKLYEHECRIIEMTLPKGSLPGITAIQMKHFVESRVNTCLQNLGYEKLFDVTYNPIAEWFYDGINSYQFNDFFSGIGAQYHRAWDEQSFVWNTRYDNLQEVA